MNKIDINLLYIRILEIRKKEKDSDLQMIYNLLIYLAGQQTLKNSFKENPNSLNFIFISEC
jgi:hypothetical protein